MQSSKVMNRLLQGDVGSGKTVVAAMALLVAIQNGYQGALMVPTEILAEQHYNTLSELLTPLGLNVVLLKSDLPKASREAALTAIADGTAHLIVGTQALIQDGVDFHKLGLAITDEQHRFGVMQRATLRHKGQMPDVLVMTATPNSTDALADALRRLEPLCYRRTAAREKENRDDVGERKRTAETLRETGERSSPRQTGIPCLSACRGIRKTGRTESRNEHGRTLPKRCVSTPARRIATRTNESSGKNKKPWRNSRHAR